MKSQHIDLAAVYAELKNIERQMVTKQQLEQAMETMAILSNEETMDALAESEQDIKNGRVKEVSSVDDI